MLPVKSEDERSKTAAGALGGLLVFSVSIRSTWNFGSLSHHFEMEKMLYPK
jgi:hypothetical protein